MMFCLQVFDLKTIIRLFLDENNDIAAIPIPKDIFKKLILLSTQGIFNKQIDGCIMGSPLRPTLANFFMDI